MVEGAPGNRLSLGLEVAESRHGAITALFMGGMLAPGEDHGREDVLLVAGGSVLRGYVFTRLTACRCQTSACCRLALGGMILATTFLCDNTAWAGSKQVEFVH